MQRIFCATKDRYLETYQRRRPRLDERRSERERSGARTSLVAQQDGAFDRKITDRENGSRGRARRVEQRVEKAEGWRVAGGAQITKLVQVADSES